jgi:transposase
MGRLGEKDLITMVTLNEKGQSNRAISRMLGVDESTVRYHLKRRADGTIDGRQLQRSKCDDHAEWIAAWVTEQGERLGRGERRETAKQLWEELVAERKFTGGYASVLRYVKRHYGIDGSQPKRRVEVQPGSQAQVDWFEQKLWIESLGGWVVLQGFVMVLSFSRKWTVIWALSQQMRDWISCHNEAFTRLGGVPWTTRVDNTKTAMAKGAGPWGTVNEDYASYALQMGFVVDPTRPYSPQEKGKVERRCLTSQVTVIRPDDRFADVEHLQRVTDERIADLCRSGLNPLTGTSIDEAWELERACLGKLPDTLPEPFDAASRRKVREDSLVCFDSKQYSVPWPLNGAEVELRQTAEEIEILVAGEVIKRYPRWTKALRLIDQDDYEVAGPPGRKPPTPLGKIGRMVVLRKSWEVAGVGRAEAGKRGIDVYERLARDSSRPGGER